MRIMRDKNLNGGIIDGEPKVKFRKIYEIGANIQDAWLESRGRNLVRRARWDRWTVTILSRQPQEDKKVKYGFGKGV